MKILFFVSQATRLPQQVPGGGDGGGSARI